MENLIKAVLAVMAEVKGMEKNSKVGSGNNSYNGTKYQDVAEVFNDAMVKHGLCMIPTDIEEYTEVNQWMEVDQWSKSVPKDKKQKQSVFTKVKTKYLLCHDSGETTTICGYGHGVDPQDKGAGKATTYALKNALLYTFLTPVGKMDDTETTHSDDIATPEEKPKPTQNLIKFKDDELQPFYTKVVAWAKENKLSVEDIKTYYLVDESVSELLTEDLK
jgi:hypothetical protein